MFRTEHSTKKACRLNLLLIGVCITIMSACTTSKPTPVDDPKATALAETVKWVEIPEEFTNLDVDHLSDVKNWRETEALIGGIEIYQNHTEGKVLCEWKPAYSTKEILWILTRCRPDPNDVNYNGTPDGQGFMMLHVNADNQIDGYYLPFGTDYESMINDILGEDNLSSDWDLLEQLTENVNKRLEGTETEPLIVKAKENLLVK